MIIQDLGKKTKTSSTGYRSEMLSLRPASQVSGTSRRCSWGSAYLKGYHGNFLYLVLKKKFIESFGILVFPIFIFLYVTYYISELCVFLSGTAEGLWPQH